MAKAMAVLAILVGAATSFVFSLRKHRRTTELAASRWRDRPTMADSEFLGACEIPDDPLMIEVALAARRVIAELGTVPVKTIKPDDSFAHDLVQLPYWDSLDWIGLVLGIERELGDRVVITEQCFDKSMRTARSQSSDLRVGHVVRAMALAATDHPKKILFDDEL
jgi:acyl carrier protein